MYTCRKLLCRHRILLFWALKSREIAFLLYSNTCLTTRFHLGTISEFLEDLLGFFDGNVTFSDFSSDPLVTHDKTHISARQVPPVMRDRQIDRNGTVLPTFICPY